VVSDPNESMNFWGQMSRQDGFHCWSCDYHEDSHNYVMHIESRTGKLDILCSDAMRRDALNCEHPSSSEKSALQEFVVPVVKAFDFAWVRNAFGRDGLYLDHPKAVFSKCCSWPSDRETLTPKQFCRLRRYDERGYTINIKTVPKCVALVGSEKQRLFLQDALFPLALPLKSVKQDIIIFASTVPDMDASHTEAYSIDIRMFLKHRLHCNHLDLVHS